MLRTYLLASSLASSLPALLAVAIPAGAAEPAKTSSWESQRMRLMPPPAPLPSDADELRGNCAGLTVTIKTRIEGLKAL